MFVAAGIGLFLDPPVRAEGLPVHLPGLDWASYALMLVTIVAAVVEVVANAVLAFAMRRAPERTFAPYAPYARGMACSLLTTLGIFLAVGYSGAFTTLVARLLGAEVQVPELLSRVVYAWGLTVLMLPLFAVVVLVRRGRAGRRCYAGHART